MLDGRTGNRWMFDGEHVTGGLVLVEQATGGCMMNV